MTFEEIANSTFEEYLEKQLIIEMTVKSTVNIDKNKIQKWLKELDIDIKTKDTKMDLINKLFDKGITHKDVYERFKDIAFGMNPYLFEKKFNLNKSQRKKMIEKQFLKVVYEKEEKIMSGIYANVPYLDAEQFYNLTLEEVENWKMENIRGYKNRVNKITE